MHFGQRTRRPIVILTILACVFALLAPWASAARVHAASAGDDPWSMICSSASDGAGSQPSGGEHDAGATHCPCCLSAHGQPALPFAPIVAVPIAPARCQAWPALFLDGPRTLQAWTLRQGRAPPLSA